MIFCLYLYLYLKDIVQHDMFAHLYFSGWMLVLGFCTEGAELALCLAQPDGGGDDDDGDGFDDPSKDGIDHGDNQKL